MKIYKDELKTDDDEARIVISCTAREAKTMAIALAIGAHTEHTNKRDINTNEFYKISNLREISLEAMAKQIFEQVGY